MQLAQLGSRASAKFNDVLTKFGNEKNAQKLSPFRHIVDVIGR